jgi:tetratricopeptide (TPR) repeat protein
MIDSKFKYIKKIISAVLVQVFLVSGISFAAPVIETANLSPAVLLDSARLNNAFYYWIEQVRKQFPEGVDSLDYSFRFESRFSLKNGYGSFKTGDYYDHLYKRLKADKNWVFIDIYALTKVESGKIVINEKAIKTIRLIKGAMGKLKINLAVVSSDKNFRANKFLLSEQTKKMLDQEEVYIRSIIEPVDPDHKRQYVPQENLYITTGQETSWQETHRAIFVEDTDSDEDYDKIMDQYYGDHPITKEAKDLEQGYQKLHSVISSMSASRIKPLLLCIDGAGSSGKTTLFNKIKAQGIGDLSSAQIEFISLDDMMFELVREHEYSKHDAAINLPNVLLERIERAKRSKRLIVLEGESFGNLLLAYDGEMIPDIAVTVKSQGKTRFKRDLMRFGLIAGLKLFNDRSVSSKAPKGSVVLTINNEGEDISIAEIIVKTTWRTITGAFEYFLPQTVVELIVDKKEYVDQKIGLFKNRVNEFRLLGLLFVPVVILSKIFDIYYLFFPEFNMIQIIKDRFGDGFIQVLDVGTGDGEFIENFKKVLKVKNIRAAIVGIDNKASAVVKAKNRGLNAHVMDVQELEKNYGENAFDLITVNAPDYPQLCVEEAMKVLSRDGILMLRTAKLHFSTDDRKKLIDNLRQKYKVQVLGRSIYNLPAGSYYKLHKPIIISHRASGKQKRIRAHNVRDINQNWEKQNNKVRILIKNFELNKAVKEFSAIKVKNEQIQKTQQELVEALKQRADDLFITGDFETAAVYYHQILKVAPHETIANLYVGACYFMNGDYEKASRAVMEARIWDPKSPVISLVAYITESLILADKILLQEWASDKKSWQEDLERFNQLSGYVDFYFSNTEKYLNDFFDSTDVNQTIFDSLLDTYHKKLEKLELALGKRKLALKNPAFVNTETVVDAAGKKMNPGELINVDFKQKVVLNPDFPVFTGIIEQAI